MIFSIVSSKLDVNANLKNKIIKKYIIYLHINKIKTALPFTNIFKEYKTRFSYFNNKIWEFGIWHCVVFF